MLPCAPPASIQIVVIAVIIIAIIITIVVHLGPPFSSIDN
jgi:hypothetical protein